MAFASHNAFNKVSLSRRDDLISTCYILAYLFDGEPVWQSHMLGSHNKNSFFSITSEIKRAMTP